MHRTQNYIQSQTTLYPDSDQDLCTTEFHSPPTAGAWGRPGLTFSAGDGGRHGGDAAVAAAGRAVTLAALKLPEVTQEGVMREPGREGW